MGYRIGSFNCLSFGLGASKDVDKFAQIIKDERFDIVALQEIKGNTALQKRILSHPYLRSDWTGMADNGCVNDYAFIWNRNRVQLVQYESNGITQVYKPRIYKQYRIDRSLGQKDLVREPYYARFVPVGGGAQFIEIRLINCHIRYSKGKTNSSADEQSEGAIKMRKNEFDVLSRTLYPKIADKRYGNNRPAYTILLGDYNLNIRGTGAGAPYLVESFIIPDSRDISSEQQKFKRIITEQRALTTLKQPREDKSEQYGFASNYDHFSYDAERFSGIQVQCSSVDTVSKYYNGDFKQHRENLSDHIPIMMDIELGKG